VKNRQKYISIISPSTHPPIPPAPLSLKEDEISDRSASAHLQTQTGEQCAASLASSSNLSGQPHTIYPGNILSCPGQETQQQEDKEREGERERERHKDINQYYSILTTTFLNQRPQSNTNGPSVTYTQASPHPLLPQHPT